MNLTVYRRISQVAFILLIFLVPVLNILRFDSATGELIIFGQVWGLGLKEGFYADRSAAGALPVTGSLVQAEDSSITVWEMAAVNLDLREVHGNPKTQGQLRSRKK